MFNNQPIGVFDSGMGGLTVLQSLIDTFPHENFIYLADEAFCPYGIKAKEEIAGRVVALGKHLIARNVKAIVIACNTASLFIKYLQAITSIPIISVIEPTCKDAIAKTQNKKVAVIATLTTINSGVYQSMLKEENIEAFPLACSEFVNIIEDGLIETEATQAFVKQKLSPFVDTKVDSMILGCTHFGLLKEKIRNVLGDLHYIESGIPTSKELQTVLTSRSLLNVDERLGEVEIYTTGNPEELESKIKWFYQKHKPIQRIDV